MFPAPTWDCSFWTVLHYLVTCSSEAEEEKWMTMSRMSHMRQEWEVFLLSNLGGLFLNLCNDEEAGSDVEHWNSAQLHQSINLYCPREVAQAPPVFYHLDSTTGAPVLPSGLCSESRMPVTDHTQFQTLLPASTSSDPLPQYDCLLWHCGATHLRQRSSLFSDTQWWNDLPFRCLFARDTLKIRRQNEANI